MRRSWISTLIGGVVAAGVGVGLAVGPLDAQQKMTLVARKATAPPPFEPAPGPAWQSAPELEFTVRGGRNPSRVSVPAISPRAASSFSAAYSVGCSRCTTPARSPPARNARCSS